MFEYPSVLWSCLPILSSHNFKEILLCLCINCVIKQSVLYKQLRHSGLYNCKGLLIEFLPKCPLYKFQLIKLIAFQKSSVILSDTLLNHSDNIGFKLIQSLFRSCSKYLSQQIYASFQIGYVTKGSPPLTRGKQFSAGRDLMCEGITPAYAGKTSWYAIR